MKHTARFARPSVLRYLLSDAAEWLKPRLGKFFGWAVAGYVTGMLIELIPHIIKGVGR
jgi:hypothetical protein